MVSTMTPRRTRHRANRVVVALVVVELFAAVLGGWRFVASHASASQTALHVGDATFTVIQTERVSGLSNADLSGMSHGIQGLVKDDETLVRVSVTVSADGSATGYDPSRLLVYTSGSAVGAPPLGGSLVPGRLRAGGSIEGTLSYVVPRSAAQIAMGTDSDGSRIALVPIEASPVQLENAPADADGEDHPHDDSTTAVPSPATT